MEIKICGITRLEDAQHAVSHGVGWLGFNFVPGGKRFIAPKQAAHIVAQLPPQVRKVGVFMNQTPTEIHAVLREVPLDVIQFHGEESPTELALFNLMRIKVFAVDAGFDARILEAYESVAEYFLFDSKVGSQTGGTGAAFDWSLLPHTTKPFFLAGGLGVANVAEAIVRVHPFALDLNSKLESAPGIKDPALVEECLLRIAQVRH